MKMGGLTPYYQDDHVTIYHGDCRELQGSLTFDVVIADPPYGTGYYENDVDITVQVLGPLHCPMAVFGYPETMVGWCVAMGRVPDEWITWWPTNSGLRGMNFKGLRRESEVIAVFGEHKLHEVRQARLTADSRRLTAGTYGWDNGAPSKRGSSNGDVESRIVPDVWVDPAPGLGFQHAARLHPNEKPVSVMSKLVQGFPDGVVLDPFMGSGSTLRAAKDLGRRAIGIELDEKHCETAAKRCAQEVLDLFAS